MARSSRTIRQLALATVFAASLGGAAWAQGGQASGGTGTVSPGTEARQVNPTPMPEGSRAAQGTGAQNNVPGVNAQQVNPSPMVPGTRAGDAPGMGGARQDGPAGAQGAPHGGPRGGGQVVGQGAAPGADPARPVQQNLSTGTPSGYPAGTPRQMGPGEATSSAAQQGSGPTTAQGATNPDRGVPGGTGANAPSAQPDVGRGTAPQAAGQAPGATGRVAGADPASTSPLVPAQGAPQRDAQAQPPAEGSTGSDRPATPGMTTPGGGAATGATTPGRAGEGGGADATPPAATTRHTEPRTDAAPVAGANSFTEGQARARIGDAGFNDVQNLQLDEQGIWRGRAMRGGQQTGVALDYQGNVVATP